MVQCLRFCGSTKGAEVQFLVKEIRSHRPHSKKLLRKKIPKCVDRIDEIFAKDF